MKLFCSKVLAILLAGVLAFTISAWLVLFRPVPQPHSNDSIEIFSHGSIGNETAQGIPYWIWRVLPQLFPEHLPGNQDGYAAIGLYWRAGDELPVGFSKQRLGVIPRVSLNCSFCHQGSYRLTADAPSIYVPGGAGTRVNPQGYVRFLAAAANDARFTPDLIMREIGAIYAMPWWERLLYRYLLIPATRSALLEQHKRFAWTTGRPDWGPGRIDPFNPVKLQHLDMSDDGSIGNSDMMPLWGLNHEQHDPTREYSLHWDGLNRSLREVVISGAIGDGMTYQSWPRTRATLLKMEDFMRLQQPPQSPFTSQCPPEDPFHVDTLEVRAGKALYEKHCSDCHSPGGTRFRTVIPAHEMGTDRHRLDMWSEAARERYAAYQRDYGWGFKAFHNEDGYVATELTGLWLKGPYLHNGSVPTLADLLKPAAQRPTHFYRGCDLVDTNAGGFHCERTEPGAWYYDTTAKGNGNAGHEIGTDLGSLEKAQLLAYLKTL